jgi:hypothetical protein
MSVDIDVVRHLAKSLLSTTLFVICSSYTFEEVDTVSGAVRWASIVTLLAAVYYLQLQLWIRIWMRKRVRRLRKNHGFDTFNLNRSQYEQSHTAPLDGLDQSSFSIGNNNNNNDDNNHNNTISNRSQSPTEIDITPSLMEDDVARSQNCYYPELTMGSVWTYVYGWGLLLFVCVYCMAAIDVPASCWWTMGMIALSFDELVSKGMKNYWVIILGTLLAVSVFCLWSGALMDRDGNMIADSIFDSSSGEMFLNFLMGVIYPVVTPFIFFTIRSTVRSVTQDVSKLCEFAMPFMVVLSLCSLAATSGVCGYTAIESQPNAVNKSVVSQFEAAHSRHLLRINNNTDMVETIAKFASSYASNLDGKNSAFPHMIYHGNGLGYLLLFLSPFTALWLIRVLILAVLTGHTTEFITAFLLVVSMRHGATHDFSVWSLAAAGGVGTAFILLLLVRRS